MWLEFNGIPLKWHYPIGVLLDIYFNDIQLPWRECSNALSKQVCNSDSQTCRNRF